MYEEDEVWIAEGEVWIIKFGMIKGEREYGRRWWGMKFIITFPLKLGNLSIQWRKLKLEWGRWSIPYSETDEVWN